jgi:nicotinate phosphoribosyltransferase
LIASKAARCVLASAGKSLVDFGLRRAHGAEAACLAARASYLAGVAATSNVLAGKLFGIPTSGTMAHSFVQAHDDEAEAFEHFARANPGNVVLLLDTYDTEAAARKVVEVAPHWKRDGLNIHAVRLDSGDLAQHAFQVRRILDAGGLREVRIFASGHLDEYELQRLVDVGAPIDGFGIGTRLDTSADAPYLDCAYKIQEYAGRPRRKRSEGKATWPGRKQVYRIVDGDGCALRDVVALEGDATEGELLLQPFMRGGRRVATATSLAEIRERAMAALKRLPEPLRQLELAPAYSVAIAPSVQALAQTLDQET